MNYQDLLEQLAIHAPPVPDTYFWKETEVVVLHNVSGLKSVEWQRESELQRILRWRMEYATEMAKELWRARRG